MKGIALTLIASSALLGLCSVTMAQDWPVTPNNTAVNVRDRAPDAMTAGEQLNAQGDLALTRRIRWAMVKDSSLSMLGHSVKIVTANGDVTLRGPVDTEAEKIDIASKAKSIAGAGNVHNHLEVETQL
jgi:hyperosmotically inducible protein